MALIKCPECGNEISSNAKSCVKCGCEIYCCPECLGVYTEPSDVCPECGFVFKKKNADLNLQEETAKIEERLNADVKTAKRASVAQKVIEIVCWAFAAVAVALYFVWNAKDMLEKFACAGDYCDNIKVMAVLFCSSFILSFSIDDFAAYFLHLRRIAWIQSRASGCKAYIDNFNAFGTEGKETGQYLSLLKNTIFLSENPNERIFSAVYVLLQAALYVAANVCVCVWLSANIEGLFAAKLLDADFVWRFNTASFICAVIFIALALGVNFFMPDLQLKRFEKWKGNG